MHLRRMAAAAVLVAPMIGIGAPSAVAATSDAQDVVNPAIEQIQRRLDELERRNQQLSMQVQELTRQNETLRAQSSPADKPAEAAQAGSDTWSSRIRFNGDFRFRHENIDNTLLSDDRTRETLRARFGAAIKVTDSVDGEIAFASGGSDPRGASSTLGAAASRKETGLDLAYMSWRPIEGLSLTAGKMREPYVRPGRSMFFDNELRPEGIAAAYQAANGLFGSAFRFWLEERAVQADSTMLGAQGGWDGSLRNVRLKLGAGYYDYGNVQGRFPGFGNSVINESGNTVVGAGVNAAFLHDYNIGQLFAEANVPFGGVPLNLFADYARNFEAHNGLDRAYSLGFLIGKASEKGRLEVGVLTQRVDKDALFGQWTDSDFAGGVTDNEGWVYRVAWMAMKNVLINITYLDTKFNLDVGAEANYDRWQMDFNFSF